MGRPWQHQIVNSPTSARFLPEVHCVTFFGVGRVRISYVELHVLLLVGLAALLEIFFTETLQGTVFSAFPVITDTFEGVTTFFGITTVVVDADTVIVGFLILWTSPNDHMSSRTNSMSHSGNSASKSSLTFKGRVDHP